MGFLRRFFSLRQKEKAPRADCRPGPSESQTQRSKKRERPRPTRRRQVQDQDQDGRAAARVADADGDGDVDPDAAVARLLRSSSANYNVVAEADYSLLPPLPHPINTVSSRSTPALTLSPSRSASMQTKGSYRVTVHKRQQLSATEFPNAYPPLTPRRPGIAHTSTPNLLATCTDSTSPFATTASSSARKLLDPRKVPITPRDVRRLSRLRQDPSVVSLVQMYDDHGRLAESAFANTPAPSRRRVRARRTRRKSTFTELLGCDGAAEDLVWAESCIAQNNVVSDHSVSNASTSSLSSTSTPPLDSPATSTFNDLELDRDVPTPGPPMTRDPSGSDITETGKEDGFSSLVVELSVATTAPSINPDDDRPAPYLGPYRFPQQDAGTRREPEKDKKTEQRNITTSGDTTVNMAADQTAGSKITRKPSQRASQIFNFIAERRERRKSQELLQASASIVSVAREIQAPSSKSAETANSVAGKPLASCRSLSPAPLMDLPDILKLESDSRCRTYSTLAPPSRDFHNNDPIPEPSSPVTLRPLYPAPRPKSRSRSSTCSQATATTMLRTGSTSSTPTLTVPVSGVPARRPARGSMAAFVLLQAEREKEKEKETRKDEVQAAQWHDAETTPHASLLPQTSTPHPSKVARPKASLKVSFAPPRDRATLGEVTNANAIVPGDEIGDFGGEFEFDKRYSAFAANLDMRTQEMNEKENLARRKRPVLDTGLARASTTTTLSSKHSHGYPEVPLTPIRSQSLRAFENQGTGPYSDLSPETAELMADLRRRKAMMHMRFEPGKQSANVA